MFGSFLSSKPNSDSDEDAKRLTSKVNRMREELAKEMIDDELLEGFVELLTDDFNRESIEVNKETVTAFRTAFELIHADRIEPEHFAKTIMVCDRYLGEERDKEDLSNRIQIADQDK